jgi:RNA polymerase II subunit A C-terminal domain phosphatase
MPNRSDIGTWARTFGAKVSPHLTKATTHVVADRDRRTSKVRQAARIPGIRIVDKMWLFECFSRWLRVDEDAFLIPVEDDLRSLPVSGLRSEEGEELAVRTNQNGAHAVEEDNEENDLEDLPESPVEEIVGDLNWDDFDDEMNEFLDSEGTSDFDESDQADDDEDVENNIPKDISSTTATNGTRKRKLSAASLVDDAADESKHTGGSRLEQRKKRAFERTSSLTNVANAAEQSSGLPSPEATTGEEGDDGGVVAAVGKDVTEDQDDDGGEMEREMLAAFADDDYDEGDGGG